jgi:UDP-glucose:(heptosyl)LPS alpha-1,3-glucosyltransferase
MKTTYDICIAVGPYNKLGGIERYNVELVGALKKDGHRISIIATEIGYPTENIDEVIITRINLFFPALNFFANAVKNSWYYFKFKKRHPEGLFISNGLPSFFSDFLIAQSVHRQAVIETNARELKTIKGYLRRFLRKVRPLNGTIIFVEFFAVRFGAKRVIAIAQKVKREIIALYRIPEEKVIVVHSGVNADEFISARQSRTQIRKECGFLDEDFLFLFSGNEFKRKGLAYAIEALAEINDPRVKLIVVGRAKDGAFKNMAREYHVADRVFFMGPTDNFAGWCSACDAFLFPTLDEAFGLVIAEALSASLPVITSGPRYAGAAECMENGVDSLLLQNPTDVREILVDMKKIIEDKSFREALGRNGRKTAEALSWKRVANGIVD